MPRPVPQHGAQRGRAGPGAVTETTGHLAALLLSEAGTPPSLGLTRRPKAHNEASRLTEVLHTCFLGGAVQEQKLRKEGVTGSCLGPCVYVQNEACQSGRKNPSKASNSFSKTQTGGGGLPCHQSPPFTQHLP